MKMTQFFVLGSMGLIASSCGSTSSGLSAGPTTPVVASLKQLTGDGQNAAVASDLASPLIVSATAADGTPVPGVAINWTVAQGGAVVKKADAVTNSQGLAQATFTAGSKAETDTIVASTGNLPSVSFTATSVAGPAAKFAIVSGNASQSVVGTVSNPLVVSVVDAFGNPVANSSVMFVAATPGATLLNSSIPNVYTTGTDSNGLAQVQVTLGTVAQDYYVSAAATNNGSSATILNNLQLFKVTGIAAAPAHFSIAPSSASAVIASANSNTSLSYAVVASDAYNNPVSGLAVNWSAQGGGSLNSSVNTDSTGTSTNSYTTGYLASSVTVTASVDAQFNLPAVNFSITSVTGFYIEAVSAGCGSTGKLANISQATDSGAASTVASLLTTYGTQSTSCDYFNRSDCTQQYDLLLNPGSRDHYTVYCAANNCQNTIDYADWSTGTPDATNALCYGTLPAAPASN